MSSCYSCNKVPFPRERRSQTLSLCLDLSVNYNRLFRDLLSRFYLYHCVWSELTGRISLQTTADQQLSQTRLHLRLGAFVLGDVQ